MHGMLLGRVVQQRSEAMAVLCQSRCVLLGLARVSYLSAKIVLDVRGPGLSTTVVSVLLLPPLAMVSNGELLDIDHDSRAVIQDWDGLSGPTLSWICVGYEFSQSFLCVRMWLVFAWWWMPCCLHGVDVGCLHVAMWISVLEIRSS